MDLLERVNTSVVLIDGRSSSSFITVDIDGVVRIE
jgi:hypothetical protein